jgi:hypothetical protein
VLYPALFLGSRPAAPTRRCLILYDMCSRVLGHLVLEAPTERGRDWMCKKTLSCPDEQALVLLAQNYIFTFNSVAFSKDGQHIVLDSDDGSDDGTVYVLRYPFWPRVTDS